MKKTLGYAVRKRPKGWVITTEGQSYLAVPSSKTGSMVLDDGAGIFLDVATGEIYQENPYSTKAEYCYERKKSPKKFAKGSFRTITLGRGKKGTVACPKRKWSKRRKSCKVGMELQRVLIPKGSGKCKVGGRELKKNKLGKLQWYWGKLKKPVGSALVVSSRFEGVELIEEYKPLFYRMTGPYKTMVDAVTASLKAGYRTLTLSSRKALSPKAIKNPPKKLPRRRKTLIYDHILAIEAIKGPYSNWPNEKFRHDFTKRGSKIYGLPNGDILISGKHNLWKNFNYDERDIN